MKQEVVDWNLVVEGNVLYDICLSKIHSELPGTRYTWDEIAILSSIKNGNIMRRMFYGELLRRKEG